MNDKPDELNAANPVFARAVGGWVLIGFVIWITGKVAGWW